MGYWVWDKCEGIVVVSWERFSSIVDFGVIVVVRNYGVENFLKWGWVGKIGSWRVVGVKVKNWCYLGMVE